MLFGEDLYFDSEEDGWWLDGGSLLHLHWLGSEWVTMFYTFFCAK